MGSYFEIMRHKSFYFYVKINKCKLYFAFKCLNFIFIKYPTVYITFVDTGLYNKNDYQYRFGDAWHIASYTCSDKDNV